MFTSKIIAWYQINKRPLPWRETNNTYFIWLSEIILQQTRVIQGLPYYERFIEAFPTVEDLAKASEQEVLAHWQGLGYYSRARNLHKCAQQVVEEHQGAFPGKYEDLLKLPGVGPYTAAAIASLGFNNPVPVVDGNVYRVLSRVFGLDANIADAKSFKLFFGMSEGLIDHEQPGAYNQAVMELGATVCLPQNPQCSTCPVEEECFARIHKRQQELPVKIKKVKKRNRYFTYLVFEVNGQLAMRRRSKSDIWKGLYEFHLVETDRPEATDTLLEATISKWRKGATLVDETSLPKHLLSHQTLYSSFLLIKISPNRTFIDWMEQKGLTLYSKNEIEALPKPVLITRYLNSVSKSINLQ